MRAIKVGRHLLDLEHLDLRDVTIAEIAHALSQLTRWTGHTRVPYSVAEHSVRVCRYLRHIGSIHERAGLMHDAHEAIIGDVSTPVKSIIPGFDVLELAAMRAVARRFGTPERLPPDVHGADMAIASAENRDLLPPHARDREWLCPPPPFVKILPWSPATARDIFLEECERLGVS